MRLVFGPLFADVYIWPENFNDMENIKLKYLNPSSPPLSYTRNLTKITSIRNNLEKYYKLKKESTC